MFGLSANVLLASEALGAETGAITVTNNNIANVNTPGYSRQVVNLSAVALAGSGLSQDGGVSFNGFTSVRDQLLQIGINQKASSASSLDAQSACWTQIEAAFSSASSGLGSAFSSFFSNISGLSTSPQDDAARQTAYSAASQLVDAFHQAAGSLTGVQANANASIPTVVSEINQLTTQIAGLNQQAASLQASGQDSGALQNQIDSSTAQLAKLVGFSSTSTESTSTLTTGDGSPLVIGNSGYSLHVSQSTDGTNHIFNAQGDDITSKITGGLLGGALVIRDTDVPPLTAELNTLASEFASAVNAAQVQGYDQTGTAGQPMFTVASNGGGAAANLTLAISNGSAIAASSDGSAGSSGNLTNLLAVQTQALPSGQTPSGSYANFVQIVGSASAATTGSLNATNAALQQLQSQQSAESGVSIDEETTNLIRYQQAYSAAAQVITTINSLFSAVLNMGN